jgi:ATP-dependent Clp protease protease subunit
MNFNEIDMSKAIMLFDQVDQYSVENATQRLGEILADNYKGEVYLFINSYGGYIEESMGFIDVLQNMENNLVTVAFGVAMSMGAVLLSLGDERYATENTKIMIHEVGGGVFGTVSDMQNTIDSATKLQDKLFTIISNTTGRDKDELLELVKGQDYFMDTAKALELNMITGVIDSKDMQVVQTNFFSPRYKNTKPRTKTKEQNVSKDLELKFANLKEDYNKQIKLVNELKKLNTDQTEMIKSLNAKIEAQENEKVDVEINRMLNEKEVVLKHEEDGSSVQFENLRRVYTEQGVEMCEVMINGYKAMGFVNQEIKPVPTQKMSFKSLIEKFENEHNRKPNREEQVALMLEADAKGV